ncbi:ACT domain-containing protein [Saccharomonospora iraqiensis]|uniref:hypothetical protein n=1 Tax=Saccharomonospora iraqiensis TaxID=52698 RepID=UPI00022DE990|nr:hypothetical protein [Saccharomonospora iraqiensis]
MDGNTNHGVPSPPTDGHPARRLAATPAWRVRIRMDDDPGTLARVAGRLADLECNILGLAVLPVPGGVLDEIVVRPAVGLPPGHLLRAVEDEGYECVGITEADVHDLVDPVTAALGTAARMLAGPGPPHSTGPVIDAVSALVSPARVAVVPADTAEAERTDGGHRAVLPDRSGRMLVLSRVWAPFTQLELARVRALLDLVDAARGGLPAQSAAGRDGPQQVTETSTPLRNETWT